MTKKLIFVFLISLMISCNRKEENMKIVFTGDVILDRGVNDQLRLHGDSLFMNAFHFLQDQDFLMINLEGVLTDSGHSPQTNKINLKANPTRAAMLKEAGITHVSIANNHIFDYGNIGYENTMKALEAHHLSPLGHSAKPTIITKGQSRCAVLSASLTTHNDALPISTIDELKSSISGFVEKSGEIPFILYIHWGLELQPVPEEWQTELAKELINLGVDAIIGHHPHVTQTIEYINDKPVFYSIGNFIADAYLPDTDVSYAVEFEINKSIERVNLIPVQLKRYFPNKLPLKDQISGLKQHLKYADVCLYRQDDKWRLKQSSEVNFSEKSDLWLCSSPASNAISTIKKINDRSFLLGFQQDGVKANVVNLHGKLSELHVADINNDNNTDVLIGISKKVKFDSTDQKRINIYTFNDDALEPLWLGTKFINKVKSFSVIRHNNQNYLATVETSNGTEEIERVYEWDDFGFALTELSK